MDVTYFALKPILVGESTRALGDLVPEAAYWPNTNLMIQDGHIAAVLVASLPKTVRDQLDAFDKVMTDAAVAKAKAEEDARLAFEAQLQSERDSLDNAELAMHAANAQVAADLAAQASGAIPAAPDYTGPEIVPDNLDPATTPEPDADADPAGEAEVTPDGDEATAAASDAAAADTGGASK